MFLSYFHVFISLNLLVSGRIKFLFVLSPAVLVANQKYKPMFESFCDFFSLGEGGYQFFYLKKHDI